MDRRCSLFVALLLCSSLVAGCNGGSSSSGPATAGKGGKPANLPAEPKQVVQDFLEAVRTGNDERASMMLTETARQETAKHDLVVTPPGSETARFTVGDVEYVMKDELAHVGSQWTDTGEDGQPHTDSIIWALRRDKDGWRVAGMAVKLFPNEPPLLLDFENPEEMIQKQRMAEEALAAGGVKPSQSAPAPTAQTPGAPGTQPPAPGGRPAANTARPGTGNVLRQ